MKFNTKLQKGKFVGGQVGFADTFNSLVELANSIRGDGKYIKVDFSNPNAPQIMWIGPTDFGGGSSTEESQPETDYDPLPDLTPDAAILAAGKADRIYSWQQGRFALSRSENGESVSWTMSNCYYSIGGKTYAATPGSITNGIVALRINLIGTSPSATTDVYAAIEQMQEAQADRDNYIIPLFTIESNAVTLDWRIGPNAAAGEF